MAQKEQMNVKSKLSHVLWTIWVFMTSCFRSRFTAATEWMEPRLPTHAAEAAKPPTIELQGISIPETPAPEPMRVISPILISTEGPGQARLPRDGQAQSLRKARRQTVIMECPVTQIAEQSTSGSLSVPATPSELFMVTSESTSRVSISSVDISESSMVFSEVLSDADDHIAEQVLRPGRAPALKIRPKPSPLSKLASRASTPPSPAKTEEDSPLSSVGTNSKLGTPTVVTREFDGVGGTIETEAGLLAKLGPEHFGDNISELDLDADNKDVDGQTGEKPYTDNVADGTARVLAFREGYSAYGVSRETWENHLTIDQKEALEEIWQ